MEYYRYCFFMCSLNNLEDQCFETLHVYSLVQVHRDDLSVGLILLSCASVKIKEDANTALPKEGWAKPISGDLRDREVHCADGHALAQAALRGWGPSTLRDPQPHDHPASGWVLGWKVFMALSYLWHALNLPGHPGSTLIYHIIP